VLVGATCAVLLIGFYTFATQRVGLQKDDAGQYVQMAQSVDYLARLPYSFRALSPLLAGAWPGGTLTGFTILTLVSLWLACLALYAYQRTLGLVPAAALAGSALFAFSGGAIRMLTTPVYVDSATYLAEATAFLCLALGRYWRLLASVVVGVLNRETALFLVPLYFLASPPSSRGHLRSGLMLALPLAAFGGLVLLKLWLGGVLGGAVPLTTLAPYARTFRQDLPTLPELFDVYSTFGVLWLLGLKNLPGPTHMQRCALVFAALVVLQLLVSRGDEGRNLSHLFVIVIPLAMLELQRLLVSRVPAGEAVGALFVLACAASMVHARWTIFEPTALRYFLAGAGTLVAVALVSLRVANQRDTKAPRRA